MVGHAKAGEEIWAFPDSVSQMIPVLMRYLAVCYAGIILVSIILVKESVEANRIENESKEGGSNLIDVQNITSYRKDSFNFDEETQMSDDGFVRALPATPLFTVGRETASNLDESFTSSQMLMTDNGASVGTASTVDTLVENKASQ